MNIYLALFSGAILRNLQEKTWLTHEEIEDQNGINLIWDRGKMSKETHIVQVLSKVKTGRHGIWILFSRFHMTTKGNLTWPPTCLDLPVKCIGDSLPI